MGLELREVWVCDSCGAEEDNDYDGLPSGWMHDFDDGDAIWDTVCDQCVIDMTKKEGDV